MQFWYRNSILKQNLGNYFLINIRFDLSKVVEKYSSNINILEFRKNQPKWFNSWSFFKNPSKENPAWKLIEEVWLKGYNLNGAYFSEKHANFLMNDWNATYKDLIKLINLAIEKIKKEKGIELIPEVIIVKN
jgi:UDP-N-acetylmuramate dehydrogenase